MKSQIKSWKRSAISLLLIVSMTPVTAFCSDEEKAVEDALARADGDVTKALYYLATDVVSFVGEIAVLEHTIDIQSNTIEVMEKRAEVKEPGFFEKLGNSTAFKIGLFVLGAYIGREMVMVH